MPISDRKTLAVIGAGPKGLAVAVKAKVLEEFGLPVDRVVLIEKNEVAAHWSGEFGYTNGEMKLGTSPEKDVVFPIETDVGDPSLTQKIRSRLMDFTWTSFLIQTRGYSDWVDRGRPAPQHRQWAAYLRWVSGQLLPEVTLLNSEVIGVDFDPGPKNWRIQHRPSLPALTGAAGTEGSEATILSADRLMITGPGKARSDDLTEGLKDLTQVPRVYDLESFWEALRTRKFSRTGKTAIVGAGENAASILLALSQYAPDLQLEIIAPKGFVSTRAENYYENQVYTHPERIGWSELSIEDRTEFVQRTDLGVFSVHAMQILNDQTRHRVVPGRLTALHRASEQLIAELTYSGRMERRIYDQVILATGFDQLATLRSFFSKSALARIETLLGTPITQNELSKRIRNDLSVQGIDPPLHLPMLAGMSQGPGFSNLSCLGLLSDRLVLQPALLRARRQCVPEQTGYAEVGA